MNKDAAEIVYRIGCRVRGTPVLYHLEQLTESQWWSEDELKALQLEKLRSLLVHACERSPFYRKHFDDHRFDCRIASLDDFKALPSLGKKELVAHKDEIQNGGRSGKLIYSKSAGTTSIPFSFYRTADWDAQHRAAIARGYSWHGVDPWMPSGYLWAIPPKTSDRIKARLLDFLQNRFREKRFDCSPETLEDFYWRLTKVDYLVGYSSMLYELARFVNERHRGDKLLSLKLVKGTSEKIFPHYRNEAQSAFGQPIRGEYGAAEAGIIAFECPEGSLHVNMEHVIVEIENEEIVVTNLLSYSFPFIRYRLGDYVKLNEAVACPCGRKGLIIEDIVGRVGIPVYGRGGKVFPSIAVDQIIKLLVSLGNLVAQCQAVQREEGTLEFYVVPGTALALGGETRIEHFFREMVPRYFGDAIDCRVHYAESIPRPDGKFLEFVSEIPQRDQ